MPILMAIVIKTVGILQRLNNKPVVTPFGILLDLFLGL
jgi:hypothetical protein